MQQEDYNSMMRHPWERLSKPMERSSPECPMCGEKYLGDGVAVCADCKIIQPLDGIYRHYTKCRIVHVATGDAQNTTKDDQ